MSTYSKDCRVCKAEKDELEAKIAKATKILDENTPKFNKWGHNYDTYDAKDMYNLISLLRETLNETNKSGDPLC